MPDISVSNNDQQKYHDINCEEFGSWYNTHKSFRKNCVVNNSYRVKIPETQLIINCEDEPIEGIYKTVILEVGEHWYLCKKSTRCVINTAYKDLTLGGKAVQNIVSKRLGNRCLHTLSVGHSAFFSIKGNSSGNTHWVALHWIKKYSLNSGILKFQTIKYQGSSLSFTFNQVKRRIEECLSRAIEHNQVFLKYIESHLIGKLNLTVRARSHVYKTLLFKCELIDPDFKPKIESLTDFVDQMNRSYIKKTCIRFYTIYEIPIFSSEIKEIIRHITRDQTNH